METAERVIPIVYFGSGKPLPLKFFEGGFAKIFTKCYNKGTVNVKEVCCLLYHPFEGTEHGNDINSSKIVIHEGVCYVKI